MPIIGTAIGAAIGWLAGTLTSIFTVDCDGTVAVEQFGVTGKQLSPLVANGGGTHTHCTYHPGSDTKMFCGSNSIYECYWSIRRV